MSLASVGADKRLFSAAYSTPKRVEQPSIDSPRPGRLTVPAERRLADSTLAEAQLVYRCGNCGAVGDLRAFPTTCLDRDGPREALYYEIED